MRADFPSFSMAAKGAHCICNQRKTFSIGDASHKHILLFTLVPHFQHLQNKISACLCPSLLTKSSVKVSLLLAAMLCKEDEEPNCL